MSETTTGAKVLQLAPPADPTKPDPDVVDALERWYARACAGEVRGIVVVADLGTSVATGLTFGDGSRHALLAGLEIAKARLVTYLLERSDDLEDPKSDVPEPGGEGGA